MSPASRQRGDPLHEVEQAFRLCLPQIKSGHIGGAIRQGSDGR